MRLQCNATAGDSAIKPACLIVMSHRMLYIEFKHSCPKEHVKATNWVMQVQSVMIASYACMHREHICHIASQMLAMVLASHQIQKTKLEFATFSLKSDHLEKIPR